MSTLGCDSVVDYLLLKMASRCNIACTYCYWFRDETVYDKPKTITRSTLIALVARLEAHIAQYKLSKFSILFHGGEPLLCREDFFREFCRGLKDVELRTGCAFNLNLTTNGILIDAHWIELFKDFNIGVTISIDGPKEINDQSRIDFRGQGTFDRILQAVSLLRSNGIEPGILTVCQPHVDPQDILKLLVDDMKFDGFDILIPDANHSDKVESISRYYKRLLDLWFYDYQFRGVRIRIIDNILLGLLGGYSESESIGYGPIRRLTILTDGSMETLDVLRIVRSGFTKTKLNVHENSIQDIQTDPLWQEVLEASLSLCPTCNSCEYRTACGGGHIASRWSNEKRFSNPSVYCEDIKSIMRHAWGLVKPTLELRPIVGSAGHSLS